MSTQETRFVYDEVNFGCLSDCSAPALTSPEIQIPEEIVAGYLVPADLSQLTSDERRANLDERDRLSRAGNLLGRLMCHAQAIDCVDLIPDRNLLVDGITGEDTTIDEFLVGFGIYTSLVRATSGINEKSKDSPTRVVHLGVRNDMVRIFESAERIFESLDDDNKELFMQTLALNFAPKHDVADSVKHPGYSGHPVNSSIFVIRNVALDIVTNCNSPLDPATIMATRLVRSFIEHPELRSDNYLVAALNEYVRDPNVLLRNPELLFALETLWSNANTKKQGYIRQNEVEKIADGIVIAMFTRIQESDRVDEYSKKLATVYFAIADKSIEQLEKRNVFSEKPSEGGYHSVAMALTQLASTVARANGDSIVFNVSQYSIAFDYILPFIDTDALWPELEPETVKTFEKAFSKIIHLTDQ